MAGSAAARPARNCGRTRAGSCGTGGSTGNTHTRSKRSTGTTNTVAPPTSTSSGYGMKNSPGSMIGGIGFTIWVRAWQASRTMPMTSSTSSSSTPSITVALDCLRNPPELWSRVARNSRSSRALTRAPASSLCTMATTSFTGRRIAHRRVSVCPRVSVRSRVSVRPFARTARDRRCTIPIAPFGCDGRPGPISRPGSSGQHAEAHVSTSPVPGSGPLAVLSAGAAALARAADLDTALAVIVEAGVAAVGASVAAVFGQPTEPDDLELLVTLGMDEAAIAALEAEVAGDPVHPIRRAAQDRIGALGRGWLTPEGETMTIADLPLVVAGGDGTQSGIGVVSFGWPGSHEVSTEEETLLVAEADLVAAAVNAFRTASLVSERAEWLLSLIH